MLSEDKHLVTINPYIHIIYNICMPYTPMKKTLVAILVMLSPLAATAQRRIYEKSDSTRIEAMLRNADSCHTGGELLLAIANGFVGEKYIGGTLEQGAGEPLYVSCTRLDCTTFVELVLAIAKTVNDGGHRFADVCRNLETIRYRNGRNSGYESRLHYISWWITDSAKTGIIEEITPQMSKDKQPLNLNFMSTHPGSYPMLAESQETVKEIELLETACRGIEVSYIPKEKTGHDGDKDIKAGDIIAITTSIPGLDITHIGFAYYNNGKLCLLHASSGKGMVIKDTTPLSEYLANNRRHTGIRVFRASF